MTKALKTWLKVGQHLLRAAMVATTLPAMAASPTGPIDLNTADAPALAAALAGVGSAKAQAIVDYRRRHGPFKSVDELALVKGIGPRTLERNRDRLTVRGHTAGASKTAGASRATPPAAVRPQSRPPAD